MAGDEYIFYLDERGIVRVRPPATQPRDGGLWIEQTDDELQKWLRENFNKFLPSLIQSEYTVTWPAPVV